MPFTRTQWPSSTVFYEIGYLAPTLQLDYFDIISLLCCADCAIAPINLSYQMPQLSSLWNDCDDDRTQIRNLIKVRPRAHDNEFIFVFNWKITSVPWKRLPPVALLLLLLLRRLSCTYEFNRIGIFVDARTFEHFSIRMIKRCRKWMENKNVHIEPRYVNITQLPRASKHPNLRPNILAVFRKNGSIFFLEPIICISETDWLKISAISVNHDLTIRKMWFMIIEITTCAPCRRHFFALRLRKRGPTADTSNE